MISGASGFLGTVLSRALRQSGHEPVPLVRREPRGDEVQWNLKQPLDPVRLSGFEAVVHLAGKNVAGLWTENFKRELLDSRVKGTQTLATSAAESFRRTGQPRVFVSASGINYYGDRGDEVLTEESAPGTGFLAEIAQQWEAANARAREAGIRVVSLRIGVVLGKDGGALKQLLLPFRLGLGGRIGSGKQYWSWIAVEDVIGAMIFAIETEKLRGPVNAVGPAPVQNTDFAKALGRVLHRPTVFPFPEIAVRVLLGEMGQELLLSSTRAVPRALQEAGFQFSCNTLQEAFRGALK